jgi:hypothetical protein
MNKFRHTILLLAFIVGFTAYAQHSHPLLGIWQQEMITQEGNRILIPVWKIISGDGTFSVILMTKDNGRTVQTIEGNYVINSDKTYTEQVKTNVFDPQQKNTTNTLNYSFDTPDRLRISYHLQGRSVPAIESWQRVKLENPFPQNDK